MLYALGRIEESDEQIKGFKNGFVMVIGLGGKSCCNIGTKVLYGMRRNPHSSGIFERNCYVHEEPWNCLDIQLVVGDLGCNLFVQVLKIKIWECRILLGL
jgi:hypothetical protein